MESDWPSISKFNPVFRRTRWLTDWVCFGFGLRVSIEMSTWQSNDICQRVSMSQAGKVKLERIMHANQFRFQKLVRNGKRMRFTSTCQNTSITFGSQRCFISDASTNRKDRKHMKANASESAIKGQKWMELPPLIQLLSSSTKFGAGTSFGGSGGGGGPARLAGGSGVAGSSGA